MNLKWKISEDRDGLRVWFRVEGYEQPQSIRFRRGTPKHDIEARVEDRIKKLKLITQSASEPTKRGFVADVDRYLKLAGVQRLPTIKERTRHMQRFAAHFGSRDRLSVTKQELEALLGEWQREEEWAAGTFNKHLSALKHFYNALDDPEGRLPNPARKITQQEEPEPTPRAIPYETIHAIFDAMGRRDIVSPPVDAQIRHLYDRGLTRTAIAKRVGYSKETVGKVLRRPPLAEQEQSLAQIRLRVIAFTGLRHGQVAKLRPEHYDRAGRRVWVTGTKKTNSFWKPLDDLGIEALDQLAAADAWGEFARKSLHRAWRTALDRLGLPLTLRPYDLRHSYLTAAYLASGDLLAVKAISGHRQLRTVERYTLAGVDPKAVETVAKMAERMQRKPQMSPEAVTGAKRQKLTLVVSNRREAS